MPLRWERNPYDAQYRHAAELLAWTHMAEKKAFEQFLQLSKQDRGDLAILHLERWNHLWLAKRYLEKAVDQLEQVSYERRERERTVETHSYGSQQAEGNRRNALLQPVGSMARANRRYKIRRRERMGPDQGRG